MDAILYVKKIELTPSVFSAINTVLNDKNAQYAITRTTPKVFTVPRRQQSQHIDDAFLGEIPKRIAICMMDNDSYNGNYKKNPFNFQHYNLTQIGISVNGEEIPFKPLKLNLDDKLFVTPYNTLFSGTWKLHGNSRSIIKREDYWEDTRSLLQTLHHFKLVIILIWKQREHWASIWFSKVLSQLLSTYWFMQNTTASLKLIATVT